MFIKRFRQISYSINTKIKYKLYILYCSKYISKIIYVYAHRYIYNIGILKGNSQGGRIIASSHCKFPNFDNINVSLLLLEKFHFHDPL